MGREGARELKQRRAAAGVVRASANFGDAADVMKKYADKADQALGNKRTSNGNNYSYDGVFTLLIINFALFLMDHVLHLPYMRMLYLNHVHPQWWQFVTSIFCHASWAHLSSNIFFLYIFGKLVEEEEGAWGVWLSYLFTGIGASLVSWLILPAKVGGGMLGMKAAATVSLGASGAVFGLFAISVLLKLRLDLKSILEVIILGQFVLQRFISEAKMATAVGGVGAGGVNHIAHLAGSLVGVALIMMLNKVVPKE